MILNPTDLTSSPNLLSPHLDTVFSAFSEHLLALLGVPVLPRGIKQDSDHHVLSDWQRDALLRYRAISNAQGSKDTLRSIINLVDQIESMPVGQDVRGDIQGALVALEEVRDHSIYLTFGCLNHFLRCSVNPRHRCRRHSASLRKHLHCPQEHFLILACWLCCTSQQNTNMPSIHPCSQAQSSRFLWLLCGRYQLGGGNARGQKLRGRHRVCLEPTAGKLHTSFTYL